MSKLLYFLAFFTLFIHSSHAQHLAFLETMNGAGGWDYPCDMVISPKGNVYVAGFSDSDSLKLGNCSIGTLPNQKRNFFISKLDTAGNCSWMETIYADSNNYNPIEIAIDAFENIYVVGEFEGQIDIDPSPNVYPLTALPNYSSLFVAKYDTYGSLLWGFNLPDSSYFITSGNTLSIDREQNLIMTGYCLKKMDLDPSANSYITVGAGQFLAKYSPSGDFILGVSGNIEIKDVEVDNSNNIIITGAMGGTIDFDFDSLSTYNVTSTFEGYSDYFLAKYTPNMSLLWAFAIPGISNWNVSGYVVKTDKNNQIYVAGDFASANIDFDPSPTDTFLLSSKGEMDIFFAKYDSTGKMLFTKSIGGNSLDRFYDMDKDEQGNFYWGLTYWSTDFDCNFTDSIQHLPQLGGGDDLIMRTDSTGEIDFLFALATFYSEGTIRCVNSYDNALYLACAYGGNLYDCDPSSNTVYPIHHGGGDILLAKYTSDNITPIETMVNASPIQVYPNPVAQNIHISGIQEDMSLQLYDLTGRLVLEKQTNTDIELNIEGFPKGLYNLVIKNSEKIASFNIIVSEF